MVPWVVIGNGVVVVPVIVPLQVSVAVGAVKLVNTQSPVIFGKLGEFATGAMVSAMITFCVLVVIFPLPSLKPQVTIYVPCVL